MKQTWQTINDIIGKGRRQSPQCKFKYESNNTITNSHDIADKSNDFFCKRRSKLHQISKTQAKIILITFMIWSLIVCIWNQLLN